MLSISMLFALIVVAIIVGVAVYLYWSSMKSSHSMLPQIPVIGNSYEANLDRYLTSQPLPNPTPLTPAPANNYTWTPPGLTPFAQPSQG